MADTLDDAEAERQAANAQARDLKARIDMVVEILNTSATMIASASWPVRWSS